MINSPRSVVKNLWLCSLSSPSCWSGNEERRGRASNVKAKHHWQIKVHALLKKIYNERRHLFHFPSVNSAITIDCTGRTPNPEKYDKLS
ncbi:hypothetical protein BDR04DRAFT_615051 [Suillus decipiens]|nr:hypothetical protein BDR04DRAFT_615051 [Suillus decipiens]